MDFTRENRSAKTVIPIPWRIYGFIGGVMVIILSILLFAFFAGNRITNRYYPLIDAVHEIQKNATWAHLWFEEHISGDTDVSLDEVFFNFNRAKTTSEKLIRREIAPLENLGSEGDLLSRFNDIHRLLSRIETMTRQRIDNKVQSGIGSEIEQEYDRVFEQFWKATEIIEYRLKEMGNKSRDHFRAAQISLMVIALILSVITGIIYHRFERNRAEAFIENIEEKERTKKRENWLFTVLESMGDAVITTTSEGYVTYMNPKAKQLTGWNLEDAKNKEIGKVFRLLNENAFSLKECPVHTIIQHGRIVEFSNHTLLQHKKGGLTPITYNGAPIRSEDGATIGVIIVFQDISERKQMENMLLNRTRELDERVNELNCLYGISKIVEQSESDIEEVLEKIVDLIPPATRYPEKACARIIYKNREYRTSNFEETPLKYELPIVIRNESGAVLQVFHPAGANHFFEHERHLLKDIAERVARILENIHTQHMMVRYNRTLKTVSECNQALVRADTEERLMQNMCRILVEVGNYRLAWIGFIHNDTDKIVHPVSWYGEYNGYMEEIKVKWDDSELGRGPTGTAIRTLKPCIFYDLRTEKDYEPWKSKAIKYGFASSISLPMVINGHCIGALNIYSAEQDAFDDEEVKLLTEFTDDLTYGIQTLRTREAHRAVELEKRELESQLHQAQKMEAMGTLAGGIAHDFNNILFPILGYTQMAMDDIPSTSITYKNLEEVVKAADRAKELVKQILAFSREGIEERQPLQAQLVVKEALKLIRATLPSTIDIHQFIDPKCPPILANPTQVHQIMMNLCTNAYHAMRESGGVLDVRLEKTTITSEEEEKHPHFPAGDYMKLSIKDTGKGIDPKIKAQIFDPYFTTKQQGEGTGLGLSVVHGIVKAHEGYIDVDSEAGQGAEFIVYLPTIERPPDIRSTEDKTPVPRGHEHILVVDDEPQIVDMIQSVLIRLGYRVTAMTQSVKALKTFADQPDLYDLVITDMTMPNMTGVQLSEKILEIRPDLPIILCTGFSEAITEEKAKAIGIREFVLKPILKRDLAITIRRSLTHP